MDPSSLFKVDFSEQQLATEEGHLGGYVLGQPAVGTWCKPVWDWMVTELGVRSVLDVGCGLGWAAEYLKSAGCQVAGIEGSRSAIENSRIPEELIPHDFTSGPVRVGAFDAVWCIEFVEHVEERCLNNFLPSLTAATRYVFMSYAGPGQPGHHHVNCRPEDYWVGVMATRGWRLDRDKTGYARDLLANTLPMGVQFHRKGLVFTPAESTPDKRAITRRTPSQGEDRGVLFTATGRRCFDEACLSARSIKDKCSGLPMVIFTDLADEARDRRLFDIVEQLEPSGAPGNQYMIDRLEVLRRTPFARTVALDTDTYAFGDFREIFEIMDRFPLVMSHGHHRVRRHDLAREHGMIPGIPYGFAPVQGGLIGYDYSLPRIRSYIDELVATYRAKDYFDDQVSMRQLMWETDLDFYILPPEYNFNNTGYLDALIANGLIEAVPKIFHYTMHKDEDVAGLVADYETKMAALRPAQPRHQGGAGRP